MSNYLFTYRRQLGMVRIEVRLLISDWMFGICLWRRKILARSDLFLRMACKQWTLATATFLLLALSLWSFVNAMLLCMSKYLIADIHLFVPHNRDGSLQIIKTVTPNTVTIVNTSLFVY